MIIDNIKNILTDNNKTLSVAESITSGHLQAAFSSAQLASKFFQGGITTHNAGQKCRHLNIEPIAALNNDCIAEQVACQMACTSIIYLLVIMVFLLQAMPYECLKET